MSVDKINMVKYVQMTRIYLETAKQSKDILSVFTALRHAKHVECVCVRHTPVTPMDRATLFNAKSTISLYKETLGRFIGDVVVVV